MSTNYIDRPAGPDERLRVAYRAPQPADAVPVQALVRQCPPLDVNSTYAYLLLCSHFAGTCAVADAGGEPVGFASGYLRPSDETVLFIWQVAVSPGARGLGIGTRLLETILDRPICRRVRHLETTITPSNLASWTLFRSLAGARQAPWTRTNLFLRDHFGPEPHEEEQLLRIGPFAGQESPE